MWIVQTWTIRDNKFSGIACDQPVEVKLYYSNDELWQKFLDEMQGVSPDMVVELVSA